MSALTIDPHISQNVLAGIPGSASEQANVALVDSSKSWNLAPYIGSNIGSYSPDPIISFYQTPEQNLSAALAAKLNELSLLKHGWDEGDALPISSEAVKEARNVLRYLSLGKSFHGPSIAPTFDGFLQLEWHNVFRSLEFEYTLEGWSILGVADVNSKQPTYNNALVPLTALQKLEEFYNWFSIDELIWPSR